MPETNTPEVKGNVTNFSQSKVGRGTSTRGFASMDKEKQREIARKGGRAAHQKGTAHEFTPDEARVAGRKGGQIVSRDRAHMAAIGREGGQARGMRAAMRKRETTELCRVEEDHRLAIEKIREFVVSHGGQPVTTSGPRGSVLRLLQGAANHLGHFAAFTILKRNEAELLRSYEEACLEEYLSPEAREALVREFMGKCRNHLSLIEHFRRRRKLIGEIFKVPA